MPFVGMRKPWGPLGPMQPESFAEKMSTIAATVCNDPEGAHVEADKLMCVALAHCGYAEGVRIFKDMEKYYT